MGWKPARVRLASSVRCLTAASKPRLNSCVLINGGAPVRIKNISVSALLNGKKIFV
jgi:hypothetical protein